jgi:hypothetical protein
VGGHLDDEMVSECAFSPEEAAAGALQHAAGCAECAARIEELSGLLASLAELPEPEIPASVLVRLDATVERAWQEADAGASGRSGAADSARKRAWRRLLVPVAALGVLVGAVFGLAHMAGGGSSEGSATSASAPGLAEGHADTTLIAMARQAIAADKKSVFDGATAPSSPKVTTSLPGGDAVRPMASCFRAPIRVGYTVVAVSAETYSGQTASLVVYRLSTEPASTTTFYAVLYAGPCPASDGPVLDEGLVSVSR